MQEDMKANKGLYVACKATFEKYGCPTEPEKGEDVISMSKAIMCLQEAELKSKEDRECSKCIVGFVNVLMVVSFLVVVVS